MSSNSGTINAVNSATTIPFTAGSSIAFSAGGPGTGSLSFQVIVTGSVTLHVAVSIDGTNFAQLPDTSITNAHDGTTGAITASGIYTVPITSGTAYVYNGSGAGSAIVTGAAGLGTGTPGTGGDSFTVPGVATALNQQDSAFRIDNTAVNNQALYIGQAAPGTATSASAWKIRKAFYDSNGNFTYWLWAAGSAAATNIWDNRGSLSYS